MINNNIVTHVTLPLKFNFVGTFHEGPSKFHDLPLLSENNYEPNTSKHEMIISYKWSTDRNDFYIFRSRLG